MEKERGTDGRGRKEKRKGKGVNPVIHFTG